MSFGSSSSKTNYNSNPTFNFPGAKDLAASLVSSGEGIVGRGDQYKAQGLDFLSGLVSGQPFRSEMSDPLKNQIESIINERNNDLGRNLAQVRSQYYRGPEGRNVMALDDAFVRNKLGTDRILSDLVQDQYNQDRSVAGNAASNLVTSGSSDFNQVLSLLSLLRGQSGSSKTSGSEFEISLSDIGSIVSAGAEMLPLLPMIPSDKRLKTNIKKLSRIEDGINLYSFSYLWNPFKKHIGLMAQEVEKVYPELVTEFFGFKAINYGKLFN